MSDRRDTIAAVATGSGRAGIGVIRISGPDVPNISRAILGEPLTARHACYLPFLSAEDQPLDVGIAIRFEAPNSYTGEDVLELQGHGGPVVLDLVLARVLECGARAARPGEFTERAFLNDRMDLAQAEAVADLIDSNSKSAAQAAVRSMSGEFSKAVYGIRDELIALRVWLEAALDFSEEEIDFLSDPELKDRTSRLIQRFDDLIANASQGQKLRDGLSVVIAGVTNVGKSSLLNALSGSDTAIVTDIAGTTRDVLHTELLIDDVPMHVIDTAGLRSTDDVVEQEGIRRAERAVESADHVLVVVDASRPELPELDQRIDAPCTYVLNKVDLLAAADPIAVVANTLPIDATASVVALSAKTGEGLAELKQHLLSLAGQDRSLEGIYLARRRHLEGLHTAQASTERALEHLQTGALPELAAEELRLGLQALDDITGRFDSEDLLGEIFSSFCIGK
ncbi:MAG: tRNA uridine-5-carboxymethylaminomethyl(34) synthesis GTPase MnmE [Gammaproteobacteria bacterium]|nr:tRNA uridine-5-carboxymethylaminomethyl(34) synthesis GTPase MnmE [Gammaproteobacteria bacterium]